MVWWISKCRKFHNCRGPAMNAYRIESDGGIVLLEIALTVQFYLHTMPLWQPLCRFADCCCWYKAPWGSKTQSWGSQYWSKMSNIHMYNNQKKDHWGETVLIGKEPNGSWSIWLVGLEAGWWVLFSCNLAACTNWGRVHAWCRFSLIG